MTRTDITKELLEDLYSKKEMDMGEIINMLKCADTTLVRYMKMYEIPRRETRGRKPVINVSKDELQDMYWGREISLRDIAGLLDCSQRSVARLMEEYEIPRRTMSEADIKIEISKDELLDMYWDREMSLYGIAGVCGCHPMTILRNMQKHEIPRRGHSSPLEKNPNWNGGSSFEPYCPKFNEVFKESIREAFGRVCFLCPKTEVENGRKLSVHHVNYNKDCLCDGAECEFVPLCGSCHTKTNFNREYWEETIMDKLEVMKCA